jgi:hypothetical protein
MARFNSRRKDFYGRFHFRRQIYVGLEHKESIRNTRSIKKIRLLSTLDSKRRRIKTIRLHCATREGNKRSSLFPSDKGTAFVPARSSNGRNQWS